ncbi:MAG: alpha/beta hydrolase family protein [Saprospiraceae bacterium]
MSYLEILLLAIVCILPFYISIKKDSTNNKYLGLLIIISLIAHVAMDGSRWQMIPIYFLSLFLGLCIFNNWKYFKGNWFRKIVSGLFLFLLLGLGFLLPTILPVFDLPTPSGEYQIGSEYLHLVSDEDENLTEETTDKRELMIKVWYPAKIKNEPKEAYLNEGDRQGFATKYGLPKNIFNYLNKVETHTFQNPTVADGKFPVLIFSHGQYSKASGYYALLEEIVSHGFIVLNINHTYESVGTLFPSNEIKLYSKEYDRKNNNEGMASMVWEAMEIYKNATDENKRIESVNHVLKNYIAAEITDRWANDFDLVVNQIPIWNNSTFLTNHIDLTKIGAFGHSQGGAATGQTVLDNPKINAGINIDGVQWGNLVDTFFSKPFLLLSSDWPEDHPNFNKYAFRNESTSDFYRGKINHSGHSSFMDIPFMINSSLINEAGEIEPEQAIEITAKVVVDFFNKYLNNENINILEVAKEYPELVFEN